MIATYLAMPARFRAVVLIGLAVFALVIVAGVYVGLRERAAVKADRAERQAEVTETVLEAERSANRNDEQRRAVRERQIDVLESAREQAITEHPDETSLPAGPAVRAVLRELREQAAGDSDTPD